MNTEEEDIDEGYVPESARLHIVSNEFDLSERQAMLQGTKMVHSIKERVLLPKVTLRW
jgi:hypothetical protein